MLRAVQNFYLPIRDQFLSDFTTIKMASNQEEAFSNQDKCRVALAAGRIALVAAALFLTYLSISSFFSGSFLTLSLYLALNIAIHDVYSVAKNASRINFPLQEVQSIFLTNQPLLIKAINTLETAVSTVFASANLENKNDKGLIVNYAGHTLCYRALCLIHSYIK